MSANHVMPPTGAGPTCAVIALLLPLVSLDRLDAEEAAAVRAHAAACATCGPALADYDALRNALRRGEFEESPRAAFRPPTMEKIMATKEPPASPTSIHSPERVSRHSTVLGPLAAVFVVALLAGVLFATHGIGGIALSGPTPTATTPSTPTTPSTGSLTQTTWTLTSLVVDGREQPLVPGRAPTLYFGSHDGEFNGSGGCNGYGGTYTLAGDMLHISSLAFTQSACLPTVGSPMGLIEQEYVYFQALSPAPAALRPPPPQRLPPQRPFPQVERYHLDGNTLTLTSADGSVQLTFRAS